MVAFDLDGTLVDQEAAAAVWAAEFADHWDLPAQAVASVGMALSARGSKGVVFDQIVIDWSIPARGDELWAAYRSRMPDLVRCSDADLEALARLRAAGWALGIVSNGMSDNQEGKIRATGLSGMVDGWVISEEVGTRKPDPAIFRALADRIGCSLNGWMVGDSLEHDIAGGIAAGLQTAWIAPPGSRSPGPSMPAITAATVALAVEQVLANAPS